MARVMKIHGELIKSREHNEKHGFYEVSKFRKMLILKISVKKNLRNLKK